MSIYKKWFYLLVAPALILFTLVILVPFLIGILYSFTSWRGTYFLGPTGQGGGTAFNSFVGFQNYIDAFNNKKFIDAFIYTIKYTVIAVILITCVSLFMALLLDKIKRGVGFFRTIYFMPNLLGGLALGFIWQFVFQIVYSQILFGEKGILHIDFLSYMTQDSNKAIIAMVIMTTWQYVGYMIIIFTAGINNIPKDLYEAADIDGADKMTTITNITLPMLMPSFTIIIFLNLANSFKLLDQNVALTDGKFDTRMLALQILRTTQDKAPPNFGQAQAQAVIFFLIVSLITLTQVIITKRKEVEL